MENSVNHWKSSTDPRSASPLAECVSGRSRVRPFSPEIRAGQRVDVEGRGASLTRIPPETGGTRRVNYFPCFAPASIIRVSTMLSGFSEIAVIPCSTSHFAKSG